MRRTGRDALSLALMDSRNRTLELLTRFDGVDVPRAEDTAPPL